jgi:hypothetical protein
VIYFYSILLKTNIKKLSVAFKVCECIIKGRPLKRSWIKPNLMGLLHNLTARLGGGRGTLVM